jgi:hypothetical protein
MANKRKTDFIGAKPGALGKWYVPRRYAHRWMAGGGSILRAARQADGESDRIVAVSRLRARMHRDKHATALAVEPPAIRELEVEPELVVELQPERPKKRARR